MPQANAHSKDDLETRRHSAAHVLAEAVLELFPDARLGIGPAVEDGFYYDFDLPRTLTPDDLEAIEGRMKAIIAADKPFSRRELPREDVAFDPFEKIPHARTLVRARGRASAGVSAEPAGLARKGQG